MADTRVAELAGPAAWTAIEGFDFHRSCHSRSGERVVRIRR
ncbi:hypothetical protein [Amycolatopsis sulphurea]|nr:hypothetical protein [Amycolatopsis sulphurea]